MPRTTAQDAMNRRFTDAIGALSDIKIFHIDPNIASIRDELLNDSSGITIADDAVWALEVFGIARAVAARFDGTQHYKYARDAIFDASSLFCAIDRWFDHRRNIPANPAGGPGSGRSGGEYRALLLKHLDWIHTKSPADDGALASLNTSMSPVTAYLQLVIRCMPSEHWAASAADPHSSPLAFAWTWTRENQEIQRRTADVVAIVTMGCSAYRNMAWAIQRAKRSAARRAADPGCFVTFLNNGSWAWSVVRSMWSQASPTRSDDYEPVSELHNEDEELLSTVWLAAKQLCEAGQQYAQLLGAENADPGHVDAVVASIRSWSELVLAKAEPPAPEAVLQAIPGLASYD